VQVALLAAALFVCQRRRRGGGKGGDYPETSTSSLAQLYDSGYSARRA